MQYLLIYFNTAITSHLIINLIRMVFQVFSKMDFRTILSSLLWLLLRRLPFFADWRTRSLYDRPRCKRHIFSMLFDIWIFVSGGSVDTVQLKFFVVVRRLSSLLSDVVTISPTTLTEPCSGVPNLRPAKLIIYVLKEIF